MTTRAANNWAIHRTSTNSVAMCVLCTKMGKDVSNYDTLTSTAIVCHYTYFNGPYTLMALIIIARVCHTAPINANWHLLSTVQLNSNYLFRVEHKVTSSKRKNMKYNLNAIFKYIISFIFITILNILTNDSFGMAMNQFSQLWLHLMLNIISFMLYNRKDLYMNNCILFKTAISLIFLLKSTLNFNHWNLISAQ